jgi:hypothetical protein
MVNSFNLVAQTSAQFQKGKNMMISQPHNPMTELNTEGFTPGEISRLNSLYVDIWNAKFSALDLDNSEIWKISTALWDAIGNSYPSESLACERAERIAGQSA